MCVMEVIPSNPCEISVTGKSFVLLTVWMVLFRNLKPDIKK